MGEWIVEFVVGVESGRVVPFFSLVECVEVEGREEREEREEREGRGVYFQSLRRGMGV